MIGRMSDYVVDVIIPVHSAERPVQRAASSALTHTSAPVRVTVVAHNIEVQKVRTALGTLAAHPQLRILELQDGVPSPANPRNFALAHATAPAVVFLDSDDELAPGAVDSWLELRESVGADAVLARIRRPDGTIDPYPPVRWGKRNLQLNAEADRLAYRSAPLGLIAREEFPGLGYTANALSGEDLVFSLTLWFTGRNITYDLAGPEYIVGGDALDRVTAEARPLADDFAFLDDLERAPWFVGASKRTREAIVVKLFRLHYLDALRARTGDDPTLHEALPKLRELKIRLEQLAPGVLGLLSIADHRVLDALHHANPPTASQLRELLAARQRFTHPSTILPKNPLWFFHRQAPFRTLLTGRLVMHRFK